MFFFLNYYEINFHKFEICVTEMKPSVEESEMLPPQRSIANTRRSQQIAEKVTSVKTKRLLT